MDYEKKHKRNLSKYQKKINDVFDKAIRTATSMGYANKDDSDFEWSKHPELKERINTMLDDLFTNVNAIVVNGITSEWELANEKNDQVAEMGVGKKENLGEEYQKIYYGRNEEGLQSFITRKENGMNLSERVWKLADQFKEETEAGIATVLSGGLKEGTSAEDMQRQVKKYLNEPNRIFRRHKNPVTGEMELSKAAKNYHPGQGVYRSSRKNALRMTATETNIAYRTSDYERVKNFDFVLGVKVVCSNNHPIKDICDELAGTYPKTFKFTGWHPWCRCHTETILKSDADMRADRKKRREALLNDEPIPEKSTKGLVDEMPDNFNKWIDDNADRIARAKKRGKLPYFLNDNEWAMNKEKAPIIKPLTAEELKAKKRATILENAKKRHENRTESEKQAIIDKWNKHNEEINQAKADAQTAITNGKEYGVETTNISDLLNKNKFNDIKKEIEKINKEVAEIQKKENELADLIPDVHDWHKQFSLQDLQSVHDAVQKKLDGWSGLPLETQVKKLNFEAVDFLGGNMHDVQNKYATWKVSQSAYIKKKKEVEQVIEWNDIKSKYADLSAYKTKSKEFNDDLSLLKDAISNNDLTSAKHWSAVANSKKDLLEKGRQQRASKKIQSKLTSAKLGEPLSDEEYIQTAKRLAENRQINILTGKYTATADESNVYSDIIKEAKKTKPNIENIKNYINSLGINLDDTYSQARKDAALWCKSGMDSYKELGSQSSAVWNISSKEEKEAAYAYTYTYCNVNEPLRGQIYSGGLSSKLDGERRIPQLTSIIDKTSLKNDMWFQRGDGLISLKQFGLDMNSSITVKDVKALSGKEGIFGAFTSAGTSKGAGFDGSVVYNIYAPRGSKGIYAEPFSKFGHGAKSDDWNGSLNQTDVGGENEIIIQRGTKFRIDKIEISGGKYYIDISIIEQKPVAFPYVGGYPFK